jgi:8-oxo-dGTP diphosphatase
MAELPILDARGGSLVSFVLVDDGGPGEPNGSNPVVSSLVVVEWDQQVLLGFNVSRQQWEIPGGAVEAGESARDAALRELEEETGIRADSISLFARAEMVFEGDATGYLAAVFSTPLDSAPVLVASEELSAFRWWNPSGDRWDGLSPVDAEIARRCLLHE